MNKHAEAQQLYLKGYQAFERGDYRSADELAGRCLALSSPKSYWHAGSLGLKCWTANFSNNLAAVESTANALLSLDTGDDKAWFDGLALLNLGLAKQRSGFAVESQGTFLRAAERYAGQQLHPGQPREWQSVINYFSTLGRWAATGEISEWSRYLDHFSERMSEPSELIQQLTAAAQLMLRYSEGEKVREEALVLVEQGVSRTFLVFILLKKIG
jgi:hypothetical protein